MYPRIKLRLSYNHLWNGFNSLLQFKCKTVLQTSSFVYKTINKVLKKWMWYGVTFDRHNLNVIILVRLHINTSKLCFCCLICYFLGNEFFTEKNERLPEIRYIHLQIKDVMIKWKLSLMSVDVSFVLFIYHYHAWNKRVRTVMNL